MPKLSRSSLRRQKYELILQKTGNSKLAAKGRDYGFKRIQREFDIKRTPAKEVTIDKAKKTVRKKDTRVFSTKETSFKEVQRTVEKLKKQKKKLTTKELRNLRSREFYRIAVKRGYTHTEATKMKFWGVKKFKEIINENQVVNKAARREKWRSMARRQAYDQELIDKASFINLGEGFDVTDGYGWAVVYYWYTLGYDIETWERAVIADKQLPDIYDDTKVKSLLSRI